MVRCLLLAAAATFTLPVLAQQPGPARFLHQAASERPRFGATVPASSLPALPAGATGPTVAAAAVLIPLRPAVGEPVVARLPLAPRHDLTGVQPAYDIYQNQSEQFRKYTLPAPYTPPLPVQLLQGLLGR